MTLKIQHVRFCGQCRELLPTKCAKCVAHPSRKPRVVALYGAPPILGTAPCGCVKVRCQRDACGELAWKKLRADGQLPERNLYCSRACHRLDLARMLRKSEERACDECHRSARRPPSATVPTVFFCSRACRWINYRKTKHAREELLARSREVRQLHHCEKCRDVTEHFRGAHASVLTSGPCGRPTKAGARGQVTFNAPATVGR